jgi:hypothetical protein
MKVSSRGAEAAGAQSLVSVMSPKSGDAGASGVSSARAASLDPSDPQSFSRLLNLDHGFSDASPAGLSAGLLQKRTPVDKSSDGSRGVAKTQSGSSAKTDTTDRSQDLSNADARDLALARAGATRASDGARAGARPDTRTRSEAGRSESTSKADSGDTSTVGLNVGTSSAVGKEDASNSQAQPADAKTQAGDLSGDATALPSDPRLDLTPAELALEAAALAAAQILAAGQAPALQSSQPANAASVAADAGKSDGVGAGISGSSQDVAGAGVSDQLALRTLQASFRPTLAAPLSGQLPATAGQPASAGGDGARVAADGAVSSGAAFASFSDLRSVPALPAAQSQAESNTLDVQGTPVVSTTPKPSSFSSLASLNVPVVNVSATSAQAEALAAAGKQTLEVSPDAERAPVPTAQDQPVVTLSIADQQALSRVSPQESPSVSQAASATVSALKVDPNVSVTSDKSRDGENFAPSLQPVGSKVGEKTTDSKGSPSAPLSSRVVPSTQKPSSDNSGNSGSKDSGDQKGRDLSAAPIVIPVRVTHSQNTQSNPPLAKPTAPSGTLGASDGGVSINQPSADVSSSEEFVPAKSQDAVLSAVADRSALAQVPVPLGNGMRSQGVEAKPTVLPPAVVKGNEVWKVVTDALQRARSENPSHLAVEVRMDDGSTLGLEVRMSSTGLQASFRSESQTLLKTLESQWTNFVTKESPEAKVTAAVFEGRTGFGNSTETGSNGGERRQQMEDAASSAALSRGTAGTRVSQTSPPAGAGPKQITPSIRTRDGRISVYA